MIPRFHCPDLDCAPGDTVALPEAAAHHASKVLRLRAGDAVTLFGGGREWLGMLLDTGRKVTAVIESESAGIAEPPLSITLVQSLPAGDKMDWVVQKAVELGVKRIQPVQAKRSVVRLAEDRAVKRVAHWQEVAVSACEQCGRNTVPEVMPVLDLNKYFAMPAEVGRRFLLAPEGGERLREMQAPTGGVTLLIGPEGGFEEGEAAAARVSGFSPLLLGPRILRTETAGLAAIAAMMAFWGDV